MYSYSPMYSYVGNPMTVQNRAVIRPGAGALIQTAQIHVDLWMDHIAVMKVNNHVNCKCKINQYFPTCSNKERS